VLAYWFGDPLEKHCLVRQACPDHYNLPSLQNMAAANGFKMEEDFKIKPDPEVGSPGSLADIDMYEDDGELIMPAGTPQGWLLRIPNELWQVLAQFETDDDYQVGQIKVWKQPNGKEKVASLYLRPTFLFTDTK
jgi:hypothetical protein